MAGQGSDGHRIVIEKVPKNDKYLVTFSKSIHGLQKKASELFTLHGAHVAIIVLSPDDRKVFLIGPPCADEVIRRFLGEEPMPEPENQIVKAHRSSVLNQLNTHDNQLNVLVDEERSKGEEINLERRETEGKAWWERPIKEMNVQQLKLFMVKTREFKRDVDEKIRLIQQENELNRGVPSRVMGGSTVVGQVHDPKVKVDAHEVPFDPMFGGSSGPAPLNPRVPIDPMMIGSFGIPDASMHGEVALFNGGQVPQNPSGFQDGGSLDPNAPSPVSEEMIGVSIDVEATINQA